MLQPSPGHGLQGRAYDTRIVGSTGLHPHSGLIGILVLSGIWRTCVFTKRHHTCLVGKGWGWQALVGVSYCKCAFQDSGIMVLTKSSEIDSQGFRVGVRASVYTKMFVHRCVGVRQNSHSQNMLYRVRV